MSNKKGVGAIIAWVLILGFAIALATTVFLWMSSQTETMSKSTVEQVEGEMQCQNIRINVVKANGCNKLAVSNRGHLTIDQLSIRNINPTSSKLHPENPELNLKPISSNCEPPSCGVTEVMTGCSDCEKVEVMPIIIISEERLVGCKDRTIVIKC